jgi:hypothetical protein
MIKEKSVLKIRDNRQSKHRTGEGTRATQGPCFPLRLLSVVKLSSNVKNLSEHVYILL